MQHIAIIGLGFMGGSLAKALNQKWNGTLTAIDKDKDSIDIALKEDVIQYGYNDSSEVEWDLFDVIIFCTPIEQTMKLMVEIDGRVKESTIVLDISSTKQEVMNLAKSLGYSFVGGHPMVGSEKSGYFHAKAHLYENAYFMLTPTETIRKEKVESLIGLFASIGSIPITLKAEEHDLYTAIISHVPHIVASTLVHMVGDAKEGKEQLLKLAAGGFKDITRIASSSAGLWEQITLSNRDQIHQVLQRFILRLQEYDRALADTNRTYIYDYFQEAKETRNRLNDSGMTDIPNQYFLIVDVEDKPGTIANIANLFYEKEINIKNIGIIHNREFEDGCLKIIVESKEEQKLAYQVLKDWDYPAYL